MAIIKKQQKKSSDSSLDVEKSNVDRGSRNLVILGIVSTGIAVLTTAVSLIVYHNSGDIYLDRSRPGFLPDESEIEAQVEAESYDFSVTGPLTKEDLDEYIKHFDETLNSIDDLTDPFSNAPLSDESLGIPAKEQKPTQESEPEPEEPVYYWW
ncbi:hypothetical protein IKE84_02915 [Candidatus Saccharibacteria bacterium]|nr:hypothetical protein [Candidatus Saccharibacteria bacterium]